MLLNSELRTFSGRSGSASSSAVGLSAISLLAMFPSRFSKSDLGTSTGSVTSSPFPKLVPVPLAKDAAPIPNALGGYEH